MDRCVASTADRSFHLFAIAGRRGPSAPRIRRLLAHGARCGRGLDRERKDPWRAARHRRGFRSGQHGKRKAWLAPTESFFGWQLLRLTLTAAARAIQRARSKARGQRRFACSTHAWTRSAHRSAALARAVRKPSRPRAWPPAHRNQLRRRLRASTRGGSAVCDSPMREVQDSGIR
jgi:hypothetical protein